jgi:D-xylose transport system permease protein
MLFAVVVIGLIFNVRTQGLFLSPRNISLLMVQSVDLAIGAVGMLLILVAGEIDLSIASAVGICSVAAAEVQVVHGYNTPITIAATLVVGVAIGLTQGLIVVLFRIPSFMVTLAGLLILQGLALIWSNASAIGPMQDGFNAISTTFLGTRPSLVIVIVLGVVATLGALVRKPREQEVGWFHMPRQPLLLLTVLALLGVVGWATYGYQGIPVMVAIAAVVALLASGVLQYTTFGRALFAIGGNREAAILAGIQTRWYVVSVFGLMGLIYGLVAVVITARLDGSVPNVEPNLLLNAIAAAVIGGASLSGGAGTVGGVLVGVLLLGTISNGLGLMNVQSFVQQVISGFIVLVAVGFDVWARRRGGENLQ